MPVELRRNQLPAEKVTQRVLQREATRLRLLDAAQDCFTRRSYPATKIDDIAAAAGVTRATFYLHFGSKSEVMLELNRRLKDASAGLDEHLSAAVMAGTRDSLRAWLQAAFEYWDQIRPLAVAIEEAASVEPAMGELRAQEFAAHVRIIDEALGQAGVRPASTRRTRAVLAYSQFQSLFYRWARTGWEGERSVVLDIVTGMWLGALSGDVAGDVSGG